AAAVATRATVTSGATVATRATVTPGATVATSSAVAGAGVNLHAVQARIVADAGLAMVAGIVRKTCFAVWAPALLPGHAAAGEALARGRVDAVLSFRAIVVRVAAALPRQEIAHRGRCLAALGRVRLRALGARADEACVLEATCVLAGRKRRRRT